MVDLKQQCGKIIQKFIVQFYINKYYIKKT